MTSGGDGPRVGPLVESESADTVEILARAFRDNPLNVAVLGDSEERRLRSNRAGMLGLVEVARVYGEVWTVRVGERVVGALVGAPPGAYPLPPPSWPRRLRGLRVGGWRAARRWAQVFRALQELHPLEPHWYLGTLGVEPSAQGAGAGSALLRDWLRHADAGGHAVYLETDREQNLSFYARAGFTVVQRAQVMGVPAWCMQRPPLTRPAVSS